MKALTKKGAGKCFNRFGIGKFEECVLKKSCSPCWKLFNGMSHTTYMQQNWVEILTFTDK